MKETRFADMITGILIMGIASYWFFEANKMMKVDLGIGPGGYPMFVSIGFFTVGFLLFIQNVIKGLPKPDLKLDRKVILRTIIFITVSFVYVRAMRYLGFLLLTPPYIFFACWFFQYRKRGVAIIASIVVTAILYVVFRMIFYVALPTFRLF